MIALCIVLAFLGLLVLLYYLFPLLLVQGDSMYPTLRHGDKLIACRVFSRTKFEVGAVYVITSPEKADRKIIKRLYDVNYDYIKMNHALYFLGDNLGGSYDSRAFGYIPSKKVVAKVIFPKKKLLKKGSINRG